MELKGEVKLGITRRTALLWWGAISFAASTPQAPGTTTRRAEINLDGRTISIDYTALSLSGRRFGRTIAPFGKVWAFGPGTPPQLTVNAYTLTELFELLPGTYSLYVIPYPDTWLLLPNQGKKGDHYHQAKDVGRLRLPVKPLPSAGDQLRFALTCLAANIARLDISFAGASVSTTLKVMQVVLTNYRRLANRSGR
ncbi:MAG: DUF2911 domain-containing protein [Acidobacteriaceae bacterium]|nr:DUF2911 domain-containing protein [Acidobacteriaceae bacterium]